MNSAMKTAPDTTTDTTARAGTVTGRPESRWSAVLGDVLRNYAVIVTVAVIVLGLAISSPSFRTTENLTNVASQCAIIGVMASGVAALFIAGEFDLSIGSVYSVAGLVMGMAVGSLGAVGGIAVALLVAAAIGVINGVLVCILRINAFMATLAMSFLIGGVAVILTQGIPVTITNAGVLKFGQSKLLGFDSLVFIMLAVVVGLSVLMQMTIFGRRVYATGGNAEAARLSGVKVVFIKTAGFVICATAAGLAGMMASSQTGFADPLAGADILLMPVAAAVVGGISIYGGKGAVWRAIAGVLLLVLINNGFNILGVNALYSQVVQGAVILLAVGIDAWTARARN